MLSTDFAEIPSGEAWTPVNNTTLNFSIQNTAEVLMEYSFTDGVTKGSYLTPYTVINGISQTLYLRFHNVNQNGTISITRES